MPVAIRSKRTARCAAAFFTVAITLTAIAKQDTPPIHPPERKGPLVVVIRRPGLRTYEKIVEEFKSGVRAAVQVVALRSDNESELLEWLEHTKPELLFVIGQLAYRALEKRMGQQPVIHALVSRPPLKGQYGLSKAPPARDVFNAFRTARPKIRKIAILHGVPASEDLDETLRVAKKLQIEIQPLAARSPAEAIQLLRRHAKNFEGLWLLPDVSILTPQVFLYAIGLQFRRRVILMGATRPHVNKGALFAIDHNPHLLGRRAATVANRLLAAQRVTHPETLGGVSYRLTVNRFTAARIKVAMAPLRKIATDVVP